MDEIDQRDQNALADGGGGGAAPTLSKSARKKLLKQQRLEARKAERKAADRERRRQDGERRRREWEEKLAAATEEEREQILAARLEARRERTGQRVEERAARAARLAAAAETGPKVVVDLEFSHLMTPSEIHSLVQQIMYCYAVNGRCPSPVHLWLTGCTGEMETQLQRIPGFDKWMIEKENKSYIEALHNHKVNLVYLTADAETVLQELDQSKIYIIGGLVDRNRWKGITMNKASEQGIQSAKLPIGDYLKMSSSQVLTVNQVVEIILKFLETKDWRTAFFHVIPPRKRGQVETGAGAAEDKAAEDKAADEKAVEDAIDIRRADGEAYLDDDVSDAGKSKHIREPIFDKADDEGSENAAETLKCEVADIGGGASQKKLRIKEGRDKFVDV